MGVYSRIVMGAEAGLMAGAGVVFLFLIQDALHLTPLATPEALAAGLFGPGGYRYDTDLLARAAGIATTATSLLGYTLLHFLTFAAVGVLAAFTLAGASWLGSLVQGGLFGATVCTGVFYGCRWLMETPVRLESVGPASVVVANLVAGVILGGALYIARHVDEQAEAPAISRRPGPD
ncbi:MAG: hypothetical protein RQ751_04785 [Longimicrobiales bacterium]|nr:hypothetical protein [Longimicrobiales bacterium]